MPAWSDTSGFFTATITRARLSLRTTPIECLPRTSRSSVGKAHPDAAGVVGHVQLTRLYAFSFRPPNALELREGGEIVVSFSDNLQTVQLRSAQLSSGPEKDGFTFDRVFPPGTKQHEVFDYGVKEYVSRL